MGMECWQGPSKGGGEPTARRLGGSFEGLASKAGVANGL